MSLDATRWAWMQDIKPASIKLILLSLADRSSPPDFTSYPSIERIVFDTGLNRKTIVSGLKLLSDVNLIEPTGKCMGKTGKIKQYRLLNVDSRDSIADNHYVYRTDDMNTNEFYIGVRSCNCVPIEDKYLGSGRWVSLHRDKKFLQKTVVAIFPTRKGAEFYESVLINENISNKLCKNLHTELYRLSRNGTKNGIIKCSNSPENGTLNSPENGTKNLSINLKQKEINKEKVNRFEKPTIQEIKIYCEERKNGIDENQYFDHYESVGWKVGKSKMKDWKAAIRTWERNRRNENGTPNRICKTYTKRKSGAQILAEGCTGAFE